MTEVRTRMGDGYAVVLTPDELRREIVEGSEDAARKAKIAPLDEADVERLTEIFATPAASPAWSRGTRWCSPRTGAPTRSTPARCAAASACRWRASRASASWSAPSASTPWRWAIPTTPSSRRSRWWPWSSSAWSRRCSTASCRCSTARCPTWVSTSGPTGRSPTPPTCCRRAASGRRGDPAGGRRPPARRHALRRPRDGRSRGPTASTSTPPPPPATPSSWPPWRRWRSSPTHDRPGHRGRHGDGAGARLPRRALLQGRAAGRPVASPAGAGGRDRPARTSSARRSRPTPARSSPWNVARACTFVKECSRVATIPVHANVGMGVGGVPTVRSAAQRRGHAGRRGAGGDRPGRRVVGRRRRPRRHVALPRARLGHGRHPHHRRPGGPDAAPQDEAAGGQAVRGGQAPCRPARPHRLDA